MHKPRVGARRVLCGVEIVKHVQDPVTRYDLLLQRIHVKQMAQFPELITVRTERLVSPRHRDTTPATASFGLAHSLIRYLQTPVILEAPGVPKVPVAFVAADGSVTRDTRRDG